MFLKNSDKSSVKINVNFVICIGAACFGTFEWDPLSTRRPKTAETVTGYCSSIVLAMLLSVKNKYTHIYINIYVYICIAFNSGLMQTWLKQIFDPAFGSQNFSFILAFNKYSCYLLQKLPKITAKRVQTRTASIKFT